MALADTFASPLSQAETDTPELPPIEVRATVPVARHPYRLDRMMRLTLGVLVCSASSLL